MAHIYKIIAPDGKVYVGSTIHLQFRWYCYRKMLCVSQTKLYGSFLEHGVDNHIFEVITVCEDSLMLGLEREYGIVYRVLGDTGLNKRLPRKFQIKRVKRIIRKAPKIILGPRNFKNSLLDNITTKQTRAILKCSKITGSPVEDIIHDAIGEYLVKKHQSHLDIILNSINN